MGSTALCENQADVGSPDTYTASKAQTLLTLLPDWV